MTAPDSAGRPGTIKLPVIGPVKKQWVWVAVALVAGIVGYAWWSRGRGPVETEVTIDPAEGSVGPGGAAPSPNPGGTVDHTSGTISTNQQWSSAAVTRLSEIGYEPGFVGSAIGKYLSGQPLTADEADVIRTAWALIGRPPVGSFEIVSPPSSGGGGAPAKPATPSNFRATKVTATSVTLQWNKVSGATTYHVTRTDSTRGGARKAGTTHVSEGLKPNTVYTYRVQAINSAGSSGFAVTTVRTAKSGLAATKAKK